MTWNDLKRCLEYHETDMTGQTDRSNMISWTNRNHAIW